MKVYEMIQQEARYAIEREAKFNGSPDLKAVTIRISPEYIELADKLAEGLDKNRQAFLAPVLQAAILEALEAYSSTFGDGVSLGNEMLREVGLLSPTKENN